MNTLRRFSLLILLWLPVLGPHAHAANGPGPDLDPQHFSQDLAALVDSGNRLVARVGSIALNPLNPGGSLSDIEAEITAYADAVADLAGRVEQAGGSLLLEPAMLDRLQLLSGISGSLAQGIQAFSIEVVAVAPTTAVIALDSLVGAMLVLSADIGVMANRILEMADNILLMADNIGLMAERILATQIIQGENLQLVTDANLQTQTNSLILASLFL